MVTAYDSRAVQYNSEGYNFYKLGKYTEAVASYDKAIAIDPNYTTAWINRGVALGNLGQYSDEIASYDKAIAIDPNNTDVWNNRGSAQGEHGQYTEAIASFEKAIAIDPNNTDAKLNLQYALKKQKQAQQTQSSPLMYAPIGAIVLVVGIAVWVRRHPN